jgi:hypothetical protein
MDVMPSDEVDPLEACPTKSSFNIAVRAASLLASDGPGGRRTNRIPSAGRALGGDRVVKSGPEVHRLRRAIREQQGGGVGVSAMRRPVQRRIAERGN